MADATAGDDPAEVTSPQLLAVPAPRQGGGRDDAPLDLAARRAQRERAIAQVLAAPIRYVPAELLEALQGAWGFPEELGLVPARPRHLRLVAG